MVNKVLIIAGEASGDLHGGGLARSLKERNPNMEIFGIGGNSMASAGMELLFHVDELSFLGLVEVVRHIPLVRRVFKHLLKQLDERQPDVIVLIDYPGFNLRFAKSAKKKGFKVFYYIAPQVWAWGRKRAQKMARFVDKLAVIFEFEKRLFTDAGLDTEFVGHPLLDIIAPSTDKKTFFLRNKLKTDKPVLALVPGSRKQEVEKLLPPLLDSVTILRESHPEVQCVVAGTTTVPQQSYVSLLNSYPYVHFILNSTYEIMAYSDAAIVASGTATLEAAWFGLPFVIVYKVSPFSYFLGKRMIKIPDIGLVNVVAGERIVPELLQKDVCPSKLVPIINELLFDDSKRQHLKTKLGRVQSLLGTPGAAVRVAELVDNLK